MHIWQPFTPQNAADFLRTGYPCTIVAARYGGSYEGGKWLAFPVAHEAVPEEVDGGDLECSTWFNDTANTRQIGTGSTPDEAFDVLKIRMRTIATSGYKRVRRSE